MPDGPNESPYGQALRAPPDQDEPRRTLPVLFVLCTIAGIGVIYVCFHCVPMLQLSVMPMQVDEGMRYRGTVETIVFHICTFMLLLCYARCVFTHPGEVPDTGWWFSPETAHRVRLPMHETKADGSYRNCRRCGKYKPDRTHHCSTCKVCVLKMDHHCPWIHNCVGFYNYKYFFLLLLYAMLDTQLVLWTMSESLARAIDENAPFITMFSILFALSLCFFLGTALTLFWCFHCMLMVLNLTTIEFCEHVAGSQAGWHSSRFNLGVLHNISQVLGANPLTWLLPVSIEGDGLSFPVSKLGYINDRLRDLERGLEPGRGSKGIKKTGSEALLSPPPVPSYGATQAKTAAGFYQRPPQARRPGSGRPCVR